MIPVGMEPAKLPSNQQVKPQTNSINAESGPAPLKVEQNKVTLSEEGKALLAALQQIDKEEKLTDNQDKSIGDNVNSFTRGALGLERPDKVEEEPADDSYDAGKLLSTAATIGGIILALV
ncbi:hypothetical protein M9194_16780 [Vibrio sp. S4M6]|uniref:hypothetical protein n=1 Tax=Vibrio sinus TaxID=2946865 RepID=UPI00202A76F2|nr:hypothetical protein [Vibrio sinus]MCL9783085.1 hypothetical protein [Vibrio sinus]